MINLYTVDVLICAEYMLREPTTTQNYRTKLCERCKRMRLKRERQKKCVYYGGPFD